MSSFITPLSQTWTQWPYKDTGQLMGGQRNHQVQLDNLQSDVFRNAQQTQDIVQAARAYSGSDVVNNLTQDEEINQDGLAVNEKEVVIEPTTVANVPAGFNFNYLQRVVTDFDAADYLSRGVANLSQNQHVGQNAFARLMDFDGIPSFAQNNLYQMEDVYQTLQADLDVDVTIHQTPATLKNARFTEILADVDNQDAQAITSIAQRQGYLSSSGEVNPTVQAAAADGAIAENNLVDVANAYQDTLVTLQEVADLRRVPVPELTPRSADLHVSMNDDTDGAHRAINSNSACQEQVLVQEASGGVEESGSPTENGGYVNNNATLNQYTKEKAAVLHDITVLV
jgi:bacterioferritin (cytochrome b1)